MRGKFTSSYLLKGVCQEQEKLAEMDLNLATLSIRSQLKGIAADVQAPKDKAKRIDSEGQILPLKVARGLHLPHGILCLCRQVTFCRLGLTNS